MNARVASFPRATAGRRRFQATGKRSARGFTLLELMVVLVVLAVLAAMGLPLFSNALPGMRFAGAARALAADLRDARRRAIAGNREVALTIDLAGRRYGLDGEGLEHALPADAHISFRTARFEVQGAQVASIRFFPDGSSTGGRIRLSSGARRYQVGVDWLTGRVSITE